MPPHISRLPPVDPFRSPTRYAALSASLFGTDVQFVEVSGDANHGPTALLPPSEAYILQLRLAACPRCDLFLDGKAIAKNDPGREGALDVHDLLMLPQAELHDPFHLLHLRLPRSVLANYSHELGRPMAGELQIEPGKSTYDATARNLFLALRTALANPLEANHLFVEHVMSALALHLLSAYTSNRPKLDSPTPRLSNWQANRVRDMIEASLAAELSLADLADAVGLSVRQMSRAFHRSFGMPPYAYLMNCRVNRARALLRDPQRRLADVALESGFANQSHFGRVFKSLVGQSPGEWRRSATSHTNW